MKIDEVLSELTYQGRICTKDCSGHKAGYQWELKHKTMTPAMTPSKSFDDGQDLAITQMKNGKLVRPKVRDDRGRFHNPEKSIKRQTPAQQTQQQAIGTVGTTSSSR